MSAAAKYRKAAGNLCEVVGWAASVLWSLAGLLAMVGTATGAMPENDATRLLILSTLLGGPIVAAVFGIFAQMIFSDWGRA